MKSLFNSKIRGLLLLGLMLMALVPISLLTYNIDLTSSVSPGFGGFIALATDSAGSRGFVITLAVFCFAVLMLKLPKKTVIAHMMVLTVLLMIGFVSKTSLKLMTESPRPYTELLAKELLIPKPSHFYRLDSEKQMQLIDNVSEKVSPWRVYHWQGETDYSFPSGHTIFAAICVAFFGGLFWKHKRYSWAIGVLAWASAVAYSRLWLGMHRPIDLVGSTLFIAVIYAVMPSFDTIANQLYLRLPKYIQNL
ncbi:phosphatase PAP2 family protein [Vibrio sp. YMD68]|uniref:phosphatase PAP2 family protein n=1 Tax=Vibrio sp. YMD68 TaxID=3042300 RepID=UPI00249BA7B2|nr:phosphatase PAP2 family protein [Vibrio sp. YMD68]WGV98677.1 phosphatase PAP2 family protein [Vibrio sp. YMD68]